MSLLSSLRRALVVVGLLVAPLVFAWHAPPTTLVLVHTNDLHGQVSPREGHGGLARLATVVRRARPDLLLDGGDLFSGSMTSELFLGKPMVAAMNGLGYRAVVLGNHEFDYGMPALQQRLNEAQFPMLSANVTGVDGVRPYTIVTANGVRIGVVGVTEEDLREGTNPKNLTGVVVSDSIEAVRKVMPDLEAQSDFIVALAHTSLEGQKRLARAFPQIRVIVAGDPHEVRATRVGDTLIVEAGSRAQWVGKVTIRLSGRHFQSATSEMIPVGDVPSDPAIAAIIAPYENEVGTLAARKLGEARANLEGTSTAESPLFDLVTDAMREAAQTQIVLFNVGAVRARIQRGPITYGDASSVLPFDDTLVTMRLTGEQLRRVLSRGVLAVSGLRVSWDLTAAPEQRLTSVTLASGEPLDDATEYSVAINDFMAAGGDGLIEFTQGRGRQDTYLKTLDAFVRYIEAHPVVAGEPDGRVTIRTR